MNKAKKDKLKGEGMLLIAAVIWGSAYIFQKSGMDHVGPFTFGFFRFTIGALVLLPVIAIFDRRAANREHRSKDSIPFDRKTLFKAGLLIGAANFIASSFQQIGIIYTTAGKAGFITSMDVVFVPLILIFFKKKVDVRTWISVLIAASGLYLLCISGRFALHLGDSLVTLCAAFYALQIILIDKYVDSVDPLRVSFLEFAVTGILSGICMLIFEKIALSDIIACAVPILYTGVLEVGLAFTLEIFGQKHVAPSVAAILMSFESVFAVMFSVLFMGEILSLREIAGCAVMFAAIMLSQLSSARN